MSTAETSRARVGAGDRGRRPLSFAQERLWFVHQLIPETHAYNTSLALRLEGPLDVTVLERAFREIVRRHEVLRTTFRVVQGLPAQVVSEAVGPVLRIVDLTRRPEPLEAARTLARDEQLAPFDLAEGPMLRVLLLRLAPEDHVLVVTLHHVVSDTRSYEVLQHELETLYHAYASGLPSPLPELEASYGDYAQWQREWFRGPERDRLLGYWLEALDGAPHVLELPLDRPRPARPTGTGAFHRAPMPPELLENLVGLARAEGATPFIAFLAVYAVVLARYSGATDFVVGVPASGRTRSEFEPLIGCFLNMLCIRIQVGDSPTFRELVGGVRDAVFSALAHHEMPFEELVKELNPERTASRTPIFQVAFSTRPSAAALPHLTGLRVSEFDTGAAGAHYDLLVDVIHDEPQPYSLWAYDDALFDPWRIEQMARHFTALAEAFVRRPEQRVLDVPILSGDERRRVVVAWNDTAAPLDDATVPDLVTAQTRMRPAAPAVVAAGVSLSYADLEGRANRLAHFLRRSGVGAETLVGVLLGRDAELVVALLAILKAEGAYVPLDPSHPRERLELVLRDAGVRFLVTDAETLETTGLEPEGTIVDVRDGRIREEPDGPPAAPRLPDALAYVIYTSGSTGLPKGVGVTHRSVVNVVHAVAGLVGFDHDDVLVATTTIAFDIATLEWLMPLTRGGTVVVASREDVLDGHRLHDLLGSSGATVLQSPPVVWQLLLDAAAGERRVPVPTALVGGEALPPALAQELVRHARVFNVYGPTETTIWSASHEVAAGDEVRVPIGRPLANTSIYVVDRSGEPVPAGVTGEIVIGGAGVARGYLGRPELTADRFVPDPFGDPPGQRLYRTGDGGRLRPDGVLEFLGRSDRQLKIRGFRVEPAEVERSLAEHPQVRESIVVGQGEHAERRLVAYVATDAELSPDELRQVARTRLPEYMVPSAFVPLAELPRNPSGKVDVAALPPPEGAVAASTSERPAAPVERRLGEIWTDLLHVDGIGVDDSFFGLGGHSLTMAQLRFAIEEAFDLEVPWLDLMERPTIREQAALIEELLIAEVSALEEEQTAQGGWGAL